MEEKVVRYTMKANGHTYAYHEWTSKQEAKDGAHKVVFCVHGLSRNARDFLTLAKKILAESDKRGERTTVVSVDVVGRGKSDYLKDPNEYNNVKYAHDIKEVLDHVCEEQKVDKVDYVGTSMGGIIAMLLFAFGFGGKIRKLVSNDIGAVIPKVALDRIKTIGDTVKADLRFNDFGEALAYVKKVAATFGPQTDEQWEEMTNYFVVKTEDNKFRLHYDYEIFAHFQPPEKAVELWGPYEAINVPVLLLHGAESDLLTDDCIKQMQERGPGAKNLLQVVTFNDCGHAPNLLSDYHCTPVIKFIFDS